MCFCVSLCVCVCQKLNVFVFVLPVSVYVLFGGFVAYTVCRFSGRFQRQK